MSKFAREAVQLASEGSQMRLKGGASVGARRGGRLGGAHVLPAYPSYPWDLGASPASSEEPWLERHQLDGFTCSTQGAVRAVPAWGALSGWLLGAPHLKSGSAPCPAMWSMALDTCRAKEMAAVSIAGSLVSACEVGPQGQRRTSTMLHLAGHTLFQRAHALRPHRHEGPGCDRDP